MDRFKDIKTPGFAVPEGYFDGLEARILAKAEKQPKVIPLYRRELFRYAAAIAASVVLIFGVYRLDRALPAGADVIDESYLAEYVETYMDISEYDIEDLIDE